jgi:hypothetical protein
MIWEALGGINNKYIAILDHNKTIYIIITLYLGMGAIFIFL